MKLVEMLMVMVIVAILGGIVTLTYRGMRERAERMGCTANLHALHTGFNAYYTDHGQWIQRPENLDMRGDKFYAWLVGEMYDYGVPRPSWVCPTDERKERVQVDDKFFEGSYFPTMFGKGPQQPFKWAHQPWVIERRSNHGTGELMIYADGSVGTMSESRGGY